MTKRKDHIWQSVFATLAVICISYGFIVLLMLGTSHWFNFAFVIVGLFFGIVSLFWNKIKKLSVLLKCAILLPFLLVLINFGIFEAKVIRTSFQKYDGNADWVILLGAKVNNTSPSFEYNKRIEKASEYLKLHPGTKIITTGGKGSNENLEESISAKNRLIQLGIDEHYIFCETKSSSTEENFEFALELIKQNGGSENDRILIISSGFHLFRANLIAKEKGFTNTELLGSTGKKILIPQYFCREYAAYVRKCMKLS